MGRVRSMVQIHHGPPYSVQEIVMQSLSNLSPVNLEYTALDDPPHDTSLSVCVASLSAIKALSSWDFFEQKTVNHINSYLFDPDTSTLIHCYTVNNKEYTEILVYKGDVVDSLLVPIDIPTMRFKRCRIVSSDLKSIDIGDPEILQVNAKLNLTYC